MFTDVKKAFDIINPHLFSAKNRPRVSLSIAMMFTSTFLNLFSAVVLMQLLSEDEPNNQSQAINILELTPKSLIALFVSVQILSRIVQSGRRLVTNPLISNTAFSLVHDINKHFLSLSHKHFAETPIGSMSEFFTTGSTGAQDLTTQIFNQIAPATIESMAAMVVAFWRFGGESGVIFAAMFTVYIAYNLSLANKIARAQKELVKNRGEMTRGITATLTGFENIQLFNNVEFELGKVNTKLDAMKRANTQSLSLPDLLAIGQNLIIGGGFVGLLMQTYPNIPAPQFIGLCFYLLLFINLFTGFGDGLSKAGAAVINLSQVSDVFQKVSEVPDTYSMQHLPQSQTYEISFKNVTFYYGNEPSKADLDNVSFTVKPGEKLGIVGQSGAGKSTLTKLLYRFYDVKSGSITINGYDLRNISLTSLREAISVVNQSPTVFNDTLENNIWYGAIHRFGANVDQDKLSSALNIASLSAFVTSLPNGLKTNVGERGLKISGGQLQRLAVARAIVKESPIILFDEATSALDSKTEKDIQSSLDNAARGRTTITISHKLYNVKNADRILVLDKGKIVEEGTHEELLARKGAYHDMWIKQSQEYDKQPDPMLTDGASMLSTMTPMSQLGKARSTTFSSEQPPPPAEMTESSLLLPRPTGSINK